MGEREGEGEAGAPWWGGGMLGSLGHEMVRKGCPVLCPPHRVAVAPCGADTVVGRTVWAPKVGAPAAGNLESALPSDGCSPLPGCRPQGARCGMPFSPLLPLG